jgi:hypothetical protein
MRWEHTVAIDAPAGRVWQLNIDVEKWPSVTPATIERVERLEPGPFGLGSTARIKQPGQTAAVWRVSHFVEGREFAWETRRLGLTMIGSHVVEPVGEGACRNVLGIEVRGRGAKLFGLVFGPMLRKAIAAENAGIARAASLPG